MDEQEFRQRLARYAVQIFADEWVTAEIPRISILPVNSRARSDERRTFIRSVSLLQGDHPRLILFIQILRAIGTRIANEEHSLQMALCELFTYLMKGHPRPGSYAGFDFYSWVARQPVRAG